MPDRHGTKLPILVLVAATPLIAELSWGSLPIQMAYALPFLVPVYGGGALLARELVHRTGRGWPSLLLLGVAHQIMEDGFGLRAMFSPHTYGAAEWGARALGVNWAYTEFNMVYHVAFTIAVPILLTDLIFPRHLQRPYLRTRGLIITAGVYLCGVALLRLTVAPNAPGADPGEPVATGHLAVAAIAVIILGLVALQVLPKARPRPVAPGAPAGPWAVGIAVAVGTVLALRVPAPLGAVSGPRPPLGHGWPVLALMAVSLVAVATVLGLLWRWSARAGWGRSHLIGVVGGALLAHTAVGASLFALGNPAELVALAVFVVLEVALIVVLHRRQPVGPQFRSDPDRDRFFALRTFRRDGSARSTPVWLAPAGGRWYGYTAGRSWKVRRMRRDERVEVAAATFRGDPLGPWRSGHARILPRGEMRRATAAMTAKYGNQFRFFRLISLLGAPRKHGGRSVGLEITLDGHPDPWP